MKKCTGCRRRKPLTEFAKNSSRKDGLQIYCRACHSKRIKAHYVKNTAYYCAKAKRASEELKAFVDSLKRGPCSDCGKRFNPWQMDFDHRDRETKVSHISRLWRFGRSKLLAELEKCDLVCANCHRDRTHFRNDYAPVAQRKERRSTEPGLCEGSNPSRGAN